MKKLHDYLLKQSFWDSGDNFSFINHINNILVKIFFAPLHYLSLLNLYY